MTILGIPIELYAAYVLACTAVVIVPGPSVTVIIANSLRHGVKAGLLNVAGTQAGLGHHAADPGRRTAIHRRKPGPRVRYHQVARSSVSDLARRQTSAFRRDHGRCVRCAAGNGSFFWQGFLVVLSNPKALFFFGALIPQFLTTGGNALAQTLLLGATFIAVATPLDSSYALLAGGAGKWLSRTRVRALEVGSGLCLIGGGVWLALARR